MVHGAVELPAVERQRLAFVHASRDPAVRLHPISEEEAERVERIEVEGEVICHR